MANVVIELNDATADAAREAGRLTSAAMERLLREALIRREAVAELLGIADRLG